MVLMSDSIHNQGYPLHESRIPLRSYFMYPTPGVYEANFQTFKSILLFRSEKSETFSGDLLFARVLK